MLNKIISVFTKNTSEAKILSLEIEKIYSIIPQDFGGGCSIQKGLLMSLLISKYRLQKTVDLGVYRGRSLFPQAIAHKLYSGGIVYGVDPYSNVAAIQNDRPDLKTELDNFLEVTDFNQLYDEVNSLIIDKELSMNCQLVREKSSNACSFFKDRSYELDLVHIDGNHDTKFVMEDANNYLPLLKTKGFIVLDDISWTSVEPAYKFLNENMIYIDKLVNNENDFALFARGLDDSEIIEIKKIFTYIKSNNFN